MAPNFVLAAVAALLLYSGYKGASLKSTLTGGEADQSSEGGSSGGGGTSAGAGGAGSVAGGSPSHPLGTPSEAEAAAHSPFGKAPSPQSIKLKQQPSPVNASTRAKVRNVRRGLTMKNNLERYVKAKLWTQQQADLAFSQAYPHYAQEAREVVAIGKATK
jgi:hypothetical protein